MGEPKDRSDANGSNEQELLLQCERNVLDREWLALEKGSGGLGSQGFLAHLHSFVVTMSQKCSVIQVASCVS